jgi:hypothetical protein
MTARQIGSLPQWLLARPPLTPQELDEQVAAARRHLERSTPDMAVEIQRVIVALADRLSPVNKLMHCNAELFERTIRVLSQQNMSLLEQVTTLTVENAKLTSAVK